MNRSRAGFSAPSSWSQKGMSSDMCSWKSTAPCASRSGRRSSRIVRTIAPSANDDATGAGDPPGGASGSGGPPHAAVRPTPPRPRSLIASRRVHTMAWSLRCVVMSVLAPYGRPGAGRRPRASVNSRIGTPPTTTDGTTEPGNADLGAAWRIKVIHGRNSVLYGNAAGPSGLGAAASVRSPSRGLKTASSGPGRGVRAITEHRRSGSRHLPSRIRMRNAANITRPPRGAMCAWNRR